MGSSFTEFRGFGFWSRDSSLELWLYLLAEQASMLDDRPKWLHEAEQHWRTMATEGLIGWIHADLDEFLTDDGRVDTALNLSAGALKWLRAHGEFVPKAELNGLGLGGPESCWTEDVRVDVLVPVGEALVALLEGKLKTDASTSPVL